MTRYENMTKLRTHMREKADPRLLDFVADPTTIHDVLLMSLGQFCMKAGVDEHEAMAFFKAFGVNSLLSFKQIIRECLYSDDDGIQPRSTSSIASEIIRNEIQNIGDIWQNLDCEGIERLARDILAAREVWLFGLGAAEIYANALSNTLSVLSIPHRTIYMREENLLTLQQTAPQDRPLVIAFSFPRYSKRVQMWLRAIKQSNTPLVCVTDRDGSPAAALSDYYFTLPVRSFDFTDSFCAGTVFVNILAVTIAAIDREHTFTKMQEREIKLDEKNMFL